MVNNLKVEEGKEEVVEEELLEKEEVTEMEGEDEGREKKR